MLLKRMRKKTNCIYVFRGIRLTIEKARFIRRGEDGREKEEWFYLDLMYMFGLDTGGGFFCNGGKGEG